MGHSHFDSELGRFISRDPIGFAGGLNLFVGSSTNPVTYTDASGLDPGLKDGGCPGPYIPPSVVTRSGSRVDTTYDSPYQASGSFKWPNVQLDYVDRNFLWSVKSKLITPAREMRWRNCHSYMLQESGLIGAAGSDDFWVSRNGLDAVLSAEIKAGGLSKVSASASAPGDLILYLDKSGEYVHSGIVESNSGGNVRVTSDWGDGGLYSHGVNSVPQSYTPAGGMKLYLRVK